MKNVRKFAALPFAATILFTGVGIAGATPAPILPATGDPGTYTEQNIAEKLIGDSSNYRIPALADLGNGVVLAAWDGRPTNAADAPNPNSIVMRRSIDNGQTWGETTFIAKGNLGTDGTQKYGYSDPSFVVDHESGKVFAFFVYCKNQGFWGSQYGNDISKNPNVMAAVVVESSDQGVTWSEPRDITSIVKPGNGEGAPAVGDIRSTFATSGEGIQLKYGEHKGRLMQQFTGMVKMPDGSEKTRAYTVYSDDHGVTWKRGGFAGIGMDENKIVELSDGRIMLNSRDFDGSGYRKVIISNDSGETWGETVIDTALPDPKNNASITRMFPDAPEGSADAKKLIFTNSNNNANSARVNLSARVSCDDGETWPSVRQFKDGFGAYSTATALSDGTFGVFYEASYKNDMRFGSFDEAWLNYVCAPVSVDETKAVAGETTSVPVTITNQEDTPLSGKVTIHDSKGFTANEVTVEAIPAGETRTVNVELTASEEARNASMDAVFTSTTGKQSRGTFQVKVPAAYVFGVTVSGTGPQSRDLTTTPYKVGDKINYNITVANTSNESVSVVPSAGNFEQGFFPPIAPNCRYSNLAVDAMYECKTASHTVTEEDIARGYFEPLMVFTVTSRTDASRTTTVEHKGERVYLTPVAPELTVTGTMSSPAQETYAEGDKIAYSFKVTNPNDYAVTVVPTAGNFDAGFLPNSAPNCRYRNLGAQASYDCTTAVHTVTAEDIARGYIDPVAVFEVSPQISGTTQTVEFAGERINLAQEPREPRFIDVPEDYPFFNEIEWLAAQGITTGWSDGTFRPTESIERGAMAAFFYRMADSPEFEAPATPTFKDVPTTHLFYKEIEWMAAQGITTGWSDGTFRPDASTERAAIAAFFYRYAGEPAVAADYVPPFTDVKDSNMFYREISWFFQQNIAKGWADGTFRPDSSIQRAAMAAFIYRYETM
ncbi:S-layer homology domain-containing protein [Rothia sp. ZJ932]|uniref:exo-alpha-sialidase n=1 Tax=Rothia sp. ZJ932 TaxID=2810516 RepID=UPI001967FDD8|nr:S-layer homology domain-containing protein [Rothia sp. ZJ932]QRZ61396.1 S-layer homology domain-containing protein [Rothia sp. ZJ932]